jgi:2-iminobutanoate/2-iminopropanoate deaminase
MPKQVLHTDLAPKAIGPYSQAIKAGSLLFCSGQVSIDPKNQEVFLGDIKQQTEMVLANIEAILRKAEMNFSNIVKTTIFLMDMADFATVNEIYGKRFPQDPPARSTVAVSGLPKGVRVEIEVIASDV